MSRPTLSAAGRRRLTAAGRRGLIGMVTGLALVGTTAAACSYQVPPLTSNRAGAAATTAQTSLVLAADGSVLQTVHGPVDRRPVPLARVPGILQDAVVATEDQRFWTEPAVDVRAVARAAVADLHAGRASQGGSTIAEQYVKIRLEEGSGRRGLDDKIREATEAYELERHQPRSQVLDDYLNAIYLGNGAYGVEAAAETYFGRPVGQVDLAQAALLAGLIHAPSATDPFTHPEAATARRREVLERMRHLRQIDAAQVSGAEREPLTARGASASSTAGPDAPYFVNEAEASVLADPAFGDTEAERSRALFAGGLRIHTTLDPRSQADAEVAVRRVLPGSASGPAAALVALDPRSGAVLALVGGQAYGSGASGSQVDLATQARRQSGSTFKPFVLTAALQAHVPLGRVFPAPASISIPVTGGTWKVRNYEGEPTGTMDPVQATVVSDNTVFAQLMMQVGPADVVSTAASLGISTPLDAYPSAVLGTNVVNPLEMAAAYGTLADDGTYNPPFFVSEVDGPGGKVLYRHRQAPRHAVSSEVARQVVGVLEQVVDRGTGVRARIGRPVAGKTGTTDSWADAWFVGATPQMVGAVWVGYPSAEKPMVPPATPFRIAGGTWPAQVFQLFASAALANEPVLDFPPADPAATAAISGTAGIVVPGVVGFPVGAATDELSRAGFVVTTTTGASGEYPPGYVMSEEPAGNTMAPGGATVRLEVSS
ncbi:MAG TPA: transglycosylase domain-containing protein [Acidimicrobiales bacterium]|nr:transglycosylase domain-containing protein [Acidimicrobiales bacterium]